MKIRNLCWIFGMTFALAACSEPRPPEEIVSERAQARWDALVARDYEKAWEYYSPGFRAENSADLFAAEISRRPVKWTAAEVLESQCAVKRCEVTTEVTYTVPRAPGQLADMGGRRDLTETWIEIDADWWYSTR